MSAAGSGCERALQHLPFKSLWGCLSCLPASSLVARVRSVRAVRRASELVRASSLNSAMVGPPVSAGTSYAGYQQSTSRNQRKQAAAEKRAWEQQPPTDCWSAACSICKGSYDRFTHCACYAAQEQQAPSKGPQFYVSPQPNRKWQTPNPGNAGYRSFEYDQNYPPVGEQPWKIATGRRQRLASGPEAQGARSDLGGPEAPKARSPQIEYKKPRRRQKRRKSLKR